MMTKQAAHFGAPVPVSKTAKETRRARLRRYKFLAPADVEVKGVADFGIKRVPKLTKHSAEHFDNVIGGLIAFKG